MATTQRLRQGIRALFAFTQTPDDALAQTYLNAEQMALFKKMRLSEQLHSLNVLRDVLAQDSDTPLDLAISALLHDVGKIRYPLAIWQKTITVIVRKVSPTRYQQWSDKNPQNLWYRAFVVAEKHPLWSKQLVEETSTSECALWLIEHHADSLDQWHGHPNAGLLSRLKQADDAN